MGFPVAKVMCIDKERMIEILAKCDEGIDSREIARLLRQGMTDMYETSDLFLGEVENDKLAA